MGGGHKDAQQLVFIKELQTKTKMVSITPSRKGKTPQWVMIHIAGQDAERRECQMLVGMSYVAATVEGALRVAHEARRSLTVQSSHCASRYYLLNRLESSRTHKNLCMDFREVYAQLPPNWKPPRGPQSPNGETNDRPSMQWYFSAIKEGSSQAT